MLCRVQPQQCGAIQGCGVHTQQIQSKFWIKLAKLLHDLVYLFEKNCSFAQQIWLGLRAEEGEVQLGGEEISQVDSTGYKGSLLPFRMSSSTSAEDLLLEKRRHLDLLLLGTGSVLNCMEWLMAKSSHIFSMIWRPSLVGAGRVKSSTPTNTLPKWQPTPASLSCDRRVWR